MVQRMEISISPLSFSLSLLHSQPFLSPPWVPRGSGVAEKEGIVHSAPNFNMSGAKEERGGVYTLLWVYYKAAITFSLFSPSFFHSLTLLTGIAGGLTWWPDSITCDSFDLMSLSGSLYLFEQLRGNCVTLAGEDVLWRRTRWTAGTRRGSVAIINEGYFPQHSQTACMRVCVSVWIAGVCACVCVWLMGGTRWGDEPLYPEGIQLWDAHWGRTHFSGLSTIVSLRVCLVFFSCQRWVKLSLRGLSEPSKCWQVMQYFSCCFWYWDLRVLATPWFFFYSAKWFKR